MERRIPVSSHDDDSGRYCVNCDWLLLYSCIRGLPNLLIITAVIEPRAPGAFQAYVGVEYTLVGTNEMPGGGPDLMDLDYVD